MIFAPPQANFAGHACTCRAAQHIACCNGKLLLVSMAFDGFFQFRNIHDH
jgi:hypothetical protein